jgi:hypothetical protein
MLNLAMESKQELHIVIYSKMALQVINLVLIATVYFDLKGTPLFFDFHFMHFFSNHFIIYLMVLFKHSFQTYKIWK